MKEQQLTEYEAPDATMALLQAQLDAGELPNARALARFSPAEMDKLVSNVGEPDWTVERKAIDKQMGVSKVAKAKLLAVSRRTSLSPTRALDVAIDALYRTTRDQDVIVPSPDEIASALAEGRTPGATGRYSDLQDS